MKTKPLNTLYAYSTLNVLTIDSSAIISFAKIDKLEYLKFFKKKIICPKEVYEEIVEQGIYLGFPDAIKIKKIFEEHVIEVKNVKKVKLYSGISNVDSKVISLAFENLQLIADDVKLSRRAKSEGINSINTLEISLDLKNQKKLNEKEYEKSLILLFDKKRISRELLKKYKQLGGIK